MKKMAWSVGLVALMILSFMISSTFAASSDKSNYLPKMKAKIEEMKKELKKFTDERTVVETNLKTFDELDFVVFSNQE